MDYTSLKMLAYYLAQRFWGDLEQHHPGMDSLHLTREVAEAWKQRQRTKPQIVTSADGEKSVVMVERIGHRQCLTPVRALYLDLSQWAIEDPGRWAQWVAPCPVGQEEISRPSSTVTARYGWTRGPGNGCRSCRCWRGLSTSGARTPPRSCRPPARPARPGVHRHGSDADPVDTKTTAKAWADDLATGKRRDLGHEDDHAFWAWAAVETLRLTGCRVEELLEISHHNLIQYRLPITGRSCRCCRSSPRRPTRRDFCRVPGAGGCPVGRYPPDSRTRRNSPLVPVYDRYECVWRPPSPVLFQRRFPSEIRAISDNSLREMLNAALVHTGLKDPATGEPLHYTHTISRIFITDAVMSGLPPHIAQVIAGHKDINTPWGIKRSTPTRPSRPTWRSWPAAGPCALEKSTASPTDRSGKNLGHFELRKVATGTCGRAFGTPCVHEHSRRPLPHALARSRPARPARRDPRQPHRPHSRSRTRRLARRSRGLKVSLAGAEDKLAQTDRRSRGPVDLGLPAPSPILQPT